MCSLQDETPNARRADLPIAQPLTINDEVTLDSIRRYFATKGNTAWADTLTRVMDALRSSALLETAQIARTGCHDCGRSYGDEHGFPDLIIPYSAWEEISPTRDDGGLLCPSCICARLHKIGRRCEGAFMSGPIISVSEPTMTALRRVENIELAIDGRDNRWSGARELVAPIARARINSLISDPGGSYIGLERSRTFGIADSRAPGVNAANPRKREETR